MREIKLTRGKVALVDDEDYDHLSQFNWQFDGNYAGRNVWNKNTKTGTRIRMHTQIAGMSFVDHRNGDKLDNRRENLRSATTAQNGYNTTLRKNNTSGFKGVCWDKIHLKWVADICVNRKKKRLGYFDTPEEASVAYDAAAKRLHGDFLRETPK